MKEQNMGQMNTLLLKTISQNAFILSEQIVHFSLIKVSV